MTENGTGPGDDNVLQRYFRQFSAFKQTQADGPAHPAGGRLRWIISGHNSGPLSFAISRDIILRLLGVVYLVAFLSFFQQHEALVGENGILPAVSFLDRAEAHLGSDGWTQLPTLQWWWRSDACLHTTCVTGMIAAALLIVGVLPLPCLLLLWGGYLTLVAAGQVFLGYQWDALLLESGLLAIFLAPPGLRLRGGPHPPARAPVILLWWLVFRLMFGSGLVKLASNDATWWSFTALDYHFWTQPLPTWTSWHAAQLPTWALKSATWATLFIELVVPFFIFLGRRLRVVACIIFLVLQVLITSTGNFTFFNLLSATLCLSLLDDACWRALFQRPPPEKAKANEDLADALIWARRGYRALISALAVLLFLVGLNVVHGQWISLRRTLMLRSERPLPDPPTTPIAQGVVDATAPLLGPLRAVNRYGLFASMTTQRPEIVIEGTSDGQTWHAYTFPWKPTDLDRKPRFVAPFQPRVDWQLWFAALGDYRRNVWFVELTRHLLLGTPEVLRVVEGNPFPDAPPAAIRATVYMYRFTTPEERAETGDWWTRELRGPYLPRPITLDDFPTRSE